MTNQETIKRIESIREYLCAGNPIWDVDEMREVFDIAISALQEQEVPDINVGDMISRQESIDTNGLDEEIRCEMCKNPMHTDRGCDGNCKYDEKLYERIMQILYERIKPLSSAQPEIVRCKDCEYGEQDEVGRWFCRSLGCQIGSEDGSGFCADAERRTDERPD